MGSPVTEPPSECLTAPAAAGSPPPASGGGGMRGAHRGMLSLPRREVHRASASVNPDLRRLSGTGDRENRRCQTSAPRRPDEENHSPEPALQPTPSALRISRAEKLGTPRSSAQRPRAADDETEDCLASSASLTYIGKGRLQFRFPGPIHQIIRRTAIS